MWRRWDGVQSWGIQIRRGWGSPCAGDWIIQAELGRPGGWGSRGPWPGSRTGGSAAAPGRPLAAPTSPPPPPPRLPQCSRGPAWVPVAAAAPRWRRRSSRPWRVSGGGGVGSGCSAVRPLPPRPRSAGPRARGGRGAEGAGAGTAGGRGAGGNSRGSRGLGGSPDPERRRRGGSVAGGRASGPEQPGRERPGRERWGRNSRGRLARRGGGLGPERHLLPRPREGSRREQPGGWGRPGLEPRARAAASCGPWCGSFYGAGAAKPGV